MRPQILASVWSFILCLALAGCGSSQGDVAAFSGDAPVVPVRAEVRGEGAELQLDFRTQGGGSGLSPLVDQLTVRGFDGAGTLMFGPHSLARPEDDVLVLNMHPDVALVEVETTTPALSAQTSQTAPTKFRVPVKLTTGVAHKVVVVVNGGGGLTPVVVPPDVPGPATLSVLPFTPSLPTTFVALGSGYLNGGRFGTDILAIDLAGKNAVQLTGFHSDGSFTLGEDTYDPDPDLSGTQFSTTGNLSSIAASFSSQEVYLRLYTSTDGLNYSPYSDGFPILIGPSQENAYGQTVLDFPFDLPMLPNLRYVWVCLPSGGDRIEGILSIATTVDLAEMDLQNATSQP